MGVGDSPQMKGGGVGGGRGEFTLSSYWYTTFYRMEGVKGVLFLKLSIFFSIFPLKGGG